MLVALAIALTVGTYTPPVKSAPLVKGIDFERGLEVGAEFKQKFDECDAGPCASDKNGVKTIRRFPNGTIFYEAKLSLDTDGTRFYGDQGDEAHQDGTSLSIDDQPTDSNVIPFIVLPGGQFRPEMGLELGDVAMIIKDDKQIPAIVADIGPYGPPAYHGEVFYWLGEGSIALHEGIGHHVRKLVADGPDKGKLAGVADESISDGVLYFVFPHSKPEGLTRANALEKIRAAAIERYNALKQ